MRRGPEYRLNGDMDAFLLLSYGAPEKKEDVAPFLQNVLNGKNVPPERLVAAAAKYRELSERTGQFSPLNEECRALLAGILKEFDTHGPKLDVYRGNLYWKPFLDETVAEMHANGVKHAVCFATSAFDSPQGNRRYADALDVARRNIGPTAPVLDKLPLPFDHPLFVEAQADRLLSALADILLDDPFYEQRDTPSGGCGGLPPTPPALWRNDIKILFSAHAIPEKDAADSQYLQQLRQTCRAVVDKIGAYPYELVFQSRSGRPSEPWTGPDIKARVREIAEEGRYRSIVVSPIGFFCENFETTWDLDREIGELCNELNLGFVRAAAVGALPKICRMIRELVVDA